MLEEVFKHLKEVKIEVHVHYHGDNEMMHLLRELKTQGEKLMSAISDFADKMKVHNDKVDAAVSGLTDDVKSLKDQITALQNSQGQITPADQALLDGIEAKAQAVSDKLEALDALTPPPLPVTP